MSVSFSYRNEFSQKLNKPLPPTPLEEEKRDRKKGKNKLTKFKPVVMPNISAPLSVLHKVHITVDPVTGDFEGMPPEWSQILGVSGLTKAEQQQNPCVLLNVLNILSNRDYDKEKFMLSCDQGNVDTSPTGQFHLLGDTNLTTGSCFSSPHHGKLTTPETETLSYFTHISGPHGPVGARSSSLSSGRGSSEGVGSHSGSGSGGAVSRSSSSGHGGAGVGSLIAPTTTGATERASAPGPNTTMQSVSHSSSASNCSTGSLSAGMEVNLAASHRSIPTSLPTANMCSSHQFCSSITNPARSVPAVAGHSLTNTDFTVLPSYSSSHMTVQPPLLSPLAHAPNSAHGMQPPHAESFVSSIGIDGKSDPKLTTSVTSADYHARVTTVAPHDSPYISRVTFPKGQFTPRAPWQSTLAGPPPLSLGLPRRFADGILPPETATHIQYSSGQSSPSPAGSVTPVPTPRRESLSASAVPARAGLNHTVPGALNTATELSRGGTTNYNLAPPPIATRPEKTKSIYTQPIDPATEESHEPQSTPVRQSSLQHGSLSISHNFETGSNSPTLSVTTQNHSPPSNVPTVVSATTTATVATTPTTVTTEVANNSAADLVSNNRDGLKDVSGTLERNPQKKTRPKLSDDKVQEKLRMIVSIGDPKRKYKRQEVIGQG
ncbi:p21-activated kinase 1 [Fasciola gigantica]|uniref:non-specific serine/threonine protein kinase n=1 Tax=Fasciola gigantica TaxID=46835 RepID=A0A504Z1X6_FASGI|nr:p21-activated kinase 1 [Fasciola gigantica]